MLRTVAEMAALESALTVFASYQSSNRYRFSAKPPDSVNIHFSSSHFPLSHNPILTRTLSSNNNSTNRLCSELCSALQEAEIEERPEQTQETKTSKKLCVLNLPWSLSAAEIKNLFGQCGTVTRVDIIKTKDDGRRSFTFVNMSSAEEAQAAIAKFDSQEVSGRIIRVGFAKKLKKVGPPAGEKVHKIYVSNLAWKVRTSHLREFITQNFKSPASARVVFDGPSGTSTGYGFVSFDTKEEAEAAISALNGKELMGRPLRLKFSQKIVREAGSKKEEEQDHEGQLEESLITQVIE